MSSRNERSIAIDDITDEFMDFFIDGYRARRTPTRCDKLESAFLSSIANLYPNSGRRSLPSTIAFICKPNK